MNSEPKAPFKLSLPFASLLVVLDGPFFVGTGIVLAQAGVVAPYVGFIIALAGVVPATGGLVLGTLAIRRQGFDWYSRLSTGIGGVHVLAVAGFAISAAGHPNINDITTDLEDPPVVWSSAGDVLPYPSEYAPIQQLAYPTVRTLTLDARPVDVLYSAPKVGERLGWSGVRVDVSGGQIRARQEVGMFAFVDDVTVRIRRAGMGTVVDVRSRSRVGRSDLGVNARRITDFLTSLTVELMHTAGTEAGTEAGADKSRRPE